MPEALTVREGPILMSAPMARATLADLKTKTRRVVKDVHNPDCLEVLRDEGAADEAFIHSKRCGSFCDYACGGELVKCPYGVPGDRLWVREAWRPLFDGEDWFIDYRAGGTYQPDDMNIQNDIACLSRPNGKFPGKRAMDADKISWRPSIHMPRWVSRITLEIVGVRVERVQEISEADAIAEGCTAEWHRGIDSPAGPAECDGHDARTDFAVLWEEINGKRPGCSWAANPWVWVLTFNRVEVAHA